MILMQPFQISVGSIQRDGNCVIFVCQWSISDQVNGIQSREKINWLRQVPILQVGSP